MPSFSWYFLGKTLLHVTTSLGASDALNRAQGNYSKSQREQDRCRAAVARCLPRNHKVVILVLFAFNLPSLSFAFSLEQPTARIGGGNAEGKGAPPGSFADVTGDAALAEKAKETLIQSVPLSRTSPFSLVSPTFAFSVECLARDTSCDTIDKSEDQLGPNA